MKKTRVNKVKLSKVTVVEAIMYLPHPLQDITDFLISLKCCLWHSSCGTPRLYLFSRQPHSITDHHGELPPLRYHFLLSHRVS